jgi:hypothetical protein
MMSAKGQWLFFNVQCTYVTSEALKMVGITQGAHKLAGQALFTLAAYLCPLRLFPWGRVLLLVWVG